MKFQFLPHREQTFVPSHLMLCRGKVGVDCEDRVKHINALWKQNSLLASGLKWLTEIYLSSEG